MPTTFASTPASLSANYLFYCWHYRVPALAIAGTVLVSSAIALLTSWHFALISGLAATAQILHWRHVRWKLRDGDLVPGVVISESPLLIASYTNMAIQGGEFFALKITRHPMPHGTKLKLGDYVAMVASYAGSVSTEAWADFFPTIVACSTRDTSASSKCVEKIGEGRFHSLESALQCVPEWRPGLHRLWRGDHESASDGTGENYSDVLADIGKFLGALALLAIGLVILLRRQLFPWLPF